MQRNVLGLDSPHYASLFVGNETNRVILTAATGFLYSLLIKLNRYRYTITNLIAAALEASGADMIIIRIRISSHTCSLRPR